MHQGKQTTTTWKNMGKSLKDDIKQKKLNKMFLMYDSIYENFKNGPD